MRKIIKHITHPVLKFLTENYFSKTRDYSYKGLTVKVVPSVFPPHYTLSTKVLLDYISTLDLKNKTVLELGCGSGIISLFAASKGAIVTASDINKKGLKTLNDSAESNTLKIETKYSDLFEELSVSPFDIILINPPYYPKEPTSIKEKAWFCGKDFEYFKKLFQQLSQRTDKTVFMILSEDCDIITIKKIANSDGLTIEESYRTMSFMETNYIYKIISF